MATPQRLPNGMLYHRAEQPLNIAPQVQRTIQQVL
jgi:hypothetical protein